MSEAGEDLRVEGRERENAFWFPLCLSRGADALPQNHATDFSKYVSMAGSFHQLQPSHQWAPLWALLPIPPPGFVHLIQAFSHSQQLLVEAFCRSLQNKALPSPLRAYGPGRVPQICPAYSRRKPALAWGAPLFFRSLVRISNLLPFSFLETFHSRNGGMENGVFLVPDKESCK